MNSKRIDYEEHKRSKLFQNIMFNKRLSMPKNMPNDYIDKLNRVLLSKRKDYPLIRKKLLNEDVNKLSIEERNLLNPTLPNYIGKSLIPESQEATVYVKLPTIQTISITDNKSSPKLTSQPEKNEISFNLDFQTSEVPYMYNIPEFQRDKNILIEEDDEPDENEVPLVETHQNNLMENKDSELFEIKSDERVGTLIRIQTKKKITKPTNLNKSHAKSTIESNQISDTKKAISLKKKVSFKSSFDKDYKLDKELKIMNIKKASTKIRMINNLDRKPNNSIFFEFQKKKSKSEVPSSSFNRYLDNKIKMFDDFEEERAKKLGDFRVKISQGYKKKNRNDLERKDTDLMQTLEKYEDD